ncbi:MarR family winged helix-turn-helix transcriptional regulator [Devosia sp.]|uniref:MarR family winged helix-turn-helix transcriptional regulator n=1 Tax=Devosia sp. TaxID=1871048 RepID=UPI003263F615
MKIELESFAKVETAAAPGCEPSQNQHKLAELAPLLYVIANVSKHFRRRVQEEAKDFELTIPQWKVLAHLSSSEGIAQSALPAMVDADAMTISGILDRLEARGLAVRSPNPKDSRAKVVHATPLAQAEVAKMREVGRGVYAKAIEGISEADVAATLATLNRISDNLAGPDRQ